MIHSFSVENFLSFKDKQIISLEAIKDKHLENLHIVKMKYGTRILFSPTQ